MATKLATSPMLKLLTWILLVVGVVALVAWIGSDNENDIGQSGTSDKTQNAEPLSDKAALEAKRAEELAKSQQASDIKQLYARFDEVRNENKMVTEQLKAISAKLQDPNTTTEELSKIVSAELERQLAAAGDPDATNMNVSQPTNDALNAFVPPADTSDSQKPSNSGQGAGVGLNGYVVKDDTATMEAEVIEWILPQGEASGGEETLVDQFLDNASGSLDFEAGAPGGKSSSGSKSGGKKEIPIIEYATVDKDAILYNATVLTELIGVVATGDAVQVPFNFKLEISQENLATSGVYLPDVAMMRMSGIVRGEWVNGCVEAKITGATFVFNDGTISDLSIGDVGKNVGGEGSYIGYLTTLHGSPCIKGKKYSNLSEFASITGGLAALSAAGDALASAQYSVQSSPENVLQTFDGSLASNAVGQGVAGGANTVNQVIAARYANVRDLVVAPSGRYVVMLSKQLNIDYNPAGRKLLNENFDNQLEDYRASLEVEDVSQ